MPDSSAIDQALIDKLLGDATLSALMPGGVHFDEAPAGRTQFVIVSLVDEHDEATFEGRSAEDALYLVKAVELSTATPRNARAAAARIDALLELGALTIAGFHLLVMRRVSRVTPRVEVDAVDSSIRWFHRGGRYQVMAAPIGT